MQKYIRNQFKCFLGNKEKKEGKERNMDKGKERMKNVFSAFLFTF